MPTEGKTTNGTRSFGAAKSPSVAFAMTLRVHQNSGRGCLLILRKQFLGLETCMFMHRTQGFQRSNHSFLRWTFVLFYFPKTRLGERRYSYREMMLVARDSGDIEDLGDFEEWQHLSKAKQARKAKPAKLSLSIFGSHAFWSFQFIS